MPTGANIRYQMDPLPVPDTTSVNNEEDRQFQKMQAAQQVPRGAGFASAPARMAFVANNVLTGWLAGRHIKQERELNKAKQEVVSSKSIYDTLAQTYSENIESGKSKDDPEMKKLAGNISAAWNNYLNTADKYSSPEDEGKGKKKSAGARIAGGVKKAFMGNVDPEMFRKGSINILRKSGAPVLSTDQSPESKEAQLRLKTEESALQEQQRELKDKNRWRDLAMKDPKVLSAEEKTELDGLERSMFPKSYEQQVRDDLMKKVVEGGQSLKPEERQVAEQMGILKPKVTSSVTWKDSKGHDWIVAIGPDGQEVSRRDMGKGYSPPDQASIADRIMKNQINTMVREYKNGYGSQYTDQAKLDADAHKFAIASVAGYKSMGATPVDAEKNQMILDKAIKTVMGEDPKKKGLYGNFVVSPADDPMGTYIYRTNLVDPQGTAGMWWWKKNTYYGGATEAELPGMEKEFRARLWTALRKQNAKMTDKEIDGLMPPPMYVGKQGGSAQYQMEPPPSSPSSGKKVRMKYPATGEEYDADPGDVQYLESKGAVRVGSK